MLNDAGFTDIKIAVKENAADIIKDWMPGSGAEKYVSSAYVTAVKPLGSWGLRDNVHRQCCSGDVEMDRKSNASEDGPDIQEDGGAACCPPGA